jgi:hypothetical protein
VIVKNVSLDSGTANVAIGTKIISSEARWVIQKVPDENFAVSPTVPYPDLPFDAPP